MVHTSVRVLALTLVLGAVACAEGGTVPDDGVDASTSGDGDTTSSSTGGDGDGDGGAGGEGGAGGAGGSGGAGGGSGGEGGSGCGDLCDEDEDGVLDVDDPCLATPTGEAVNPSGCSDSQVDPTLETMWPPYGLTWGPTGDLGRAGGLTWTYTGITKGDLFHVHWVPCDDPGTPCGVSLDGAIDASEEWLFSAAESNLAGGVLVFTNTTQIILFDASVVPLTGRMSLTIVGEGGVALAFEEVGAAGVPARDGLYAAEVPGTTFTVTTRIEVQDSGMVWTPYLDYYDAASTPDPGTGTSVSFGGSFYDE